MTSAKAKRSGKKRTGISSKTLIGWREYVALPQFSIDRIKAKVDTGARSSAIHAWNIEPFEKDGEPWVSFDLHPVQRDNTPSVACVAPLVTQRLVKSSSGHQENRFVVKTMLSLGGMTFPVELSLTNRDEMGFRLLLGRTAVRKRFVVDPGRSYLASASEE